MHLPRKRFGQHFLCDQQVIARIVAALSPKPGQHLVEIGPGQGALTLPVLKHHHHLDVVELDRDLIPALKERTQHIGELRVYAADALTFDFASLYTDQKPLRIFGNLPYNISTPLLFHLLTFSPVVSDMLFMLQKEVALRLAAPVSSADYGRLSVMTQYHCQVDVLFDIGPDAFYPPPKVQSSIVRMLPYQEKPFIARDYSLFAELVRLAFGQRRKTLRNSLRDKVTDAVWEQVQISSTLRAENLTVADFVKLSNALT